MTLNSATVLRIIGQRKGECGYIPYLKRNKERQKIAARFCYVTGKISKVTKIFKKLDVFKEYK